MRTPWVVFAFSLISMAAAAHLGAHLQKRFRPLDTDDRSDLGIILGATLTLLGLILGFSFSMAISRYDLRKNYEEAEANAIGTEYVRADLLAGDSSQKVRELLRKYLEQRIAFYTTRDQPEQDRLARETADLQTELWAAVRSPVLAQPTPPGALVLSGMNDVLNSQGYTQAAWWNRIPTQAWNLMAAIAICSNLLLGFVVRRLAMRTDVLLLVLPLIVSVSFSLIADIDTPRRGLVQVVPQNLISLLESIRK
jgi:hypothetical protein